MNIEKPDLIQVEKQFTSKTS